MPETKLNSVVSQKIEIAPGLIVLRVVPDGWELPKFEPGQFAVLGLPGSANRYYLSDDEEEKPDPDKLIRRAYSVSSASEQKEYVEFYITLVRSGALTPRLYDLKPGDRLFMSPKFTGFFTLDSVPEKKHVILLATGTGLAPYMSMLRSSLPCGADARFVVVHGARHSWDLGYRSELNSFTRICRNFRYIPIIDHPEEEPVKWMGETGFIQDLWKRKALHEKAGFDPKPDNCHIFLCGNPLMIEAMIEILTEEGFKEQTKNEPGEIHLERYW